MQALKTTRIKLGISGAAILLETGRDFKGLPLPETGYSDLKLGLIPFTVDKELHIELLLEVAIGASEDIAIVGYDGSHLIKVEDGGKILFEAGDVCDTIANYTSRYIKIGKVIGDFDTLTYPFINLQGVEYESLMRINFETKQSSVMNADFKNIVISEKGDVFVKALTINN